MWINTESALDNWLEEAEKASELAIDTESNGFHAYQSRICLLQMATPQAEVLIDVLVFQPEQLQRMDALFRNPKITKVFHASENDLYGLQRDFGFRINSLFDTSLATRFLGLPFHGLGKLLKKYFDVQVSKKFQRLNWKQRPIPEQAQEYALIDVRYLLELKSILETELQKVGWLQAVQEESTALTQKVFEIKGFDYDAYRRTPTAKTFSHQQLGALRSLYLWRHAYCREHDIAAFFILSDQAMYALAERRPWHYEELFDVRLLTPKQIRKFGNSFISAIRRGSRMGVPPNFRPPRIYERNKEQELELQEQYEKFRGWRHELAQQEALEAGLLLPNQVLKNLARTRPSSLEQLVTVPGMHPWRIQRYGKQILEQLRS